MIYAAPNMEGSLIAFQSRYGNYIGGEFVPPVDGDYFENVSPVNGKTFCEIPRSRASEHSASASLVFPYCSSSLCQALADVIIAW